MSVVRFLARPMLVAGAALLATCLLAGPAAAASVSCRLDGLPSRMTAGGPGAFLRASISNAKPETITDLEIVYTIRLDGLETDQMRFSRFFANLKISGGGGEVRIVDTAHLSRGRALLNYTLQFLATAPAGRATVSMDAYLRAGGEHVGSTRVSTNVQSLRPTASRTASPGPTPTLALGPADVRPGASGEPTLLPVPRAAGGSDGDSGLWPLYVFGFLLVVGGGGAAAFLLLRRPKEIEPEYAYVGGPVGGYAGGPVGAGYAGGPVGGGYQDAPTAALPIISGQPDDYDQPTHGVDPWPDEGRHPGRYRDGGPGQHQDYQHFRGDGPPG